jgi:hypothetical protein
MCGINKNVQMPNGFVHFTILLNKEKSKWTFGKYIILIQATSIASS